MSEEPMQFVLFDLGAYDEPDTLTKAEYFRERTAALRTTWQRRHEALLADAPPTVAGRPYQDVDVVEGVL